MWKCTKCQSVEVEELGWVDMNTGEYMSGADDEYYCRTCEAGTEVWFDEGDGDVPKIQSQTNDTENIF